MMGGFLLTVTLLTFYVGGQGRLYPNGRRGEATTEGPSNVTLQQVDMTNHTRVKNEGLSFRIDSTDVMTYMDKETTVLLLYSVNCTVPPLNDYDFVVRVTDSTVIRIAKVKPSIIDDVVVECTAQAGRGIGTAISGSLSVTVEGLLPGRSLLIIDAVSKNATSVLNPVQISAENVSSPEYHLTSSNESLASAQPFVAASAENLSDVEQEYFPATLHVICMKEQTALDTVFRVLMVLFLICLMVAMGCKTELPVLREVWRRPIAPLIGLACQFFLMPLIAFALTMAVHFPSETVALGFFACGCAPGGGASNFYAYLLNGDVSLSVTMTTISNLAAIGTFPLWIFTLGRFVLKDHSQIKIPYVNIFISLLMIVIPLSIGIALKHKRPARAQSVVRYLIPLTIFQLVIVSAMGVYLNIYMFRLITPVLLIATFLLPNTGFVIGFILARIFKQSWKFSRTIAIETGVQNIGIAFIMVMFSFPPPDNVLAGIAPVTSSMMTSIPLLIAAAIYHLYLRFYAKRKYSSGSHSVYFLKHDDLDSYKTTSKELEIEWDKTVMG